MRTLRIECADKLFDWFDVEEEKEIINAPDVLRILKENVVHYFNLQLENQVIFDEEGVISSASEFRRSLRCAGKPKVTVADIHNLSDKQRTMWTQFITDMKHNFTSIPALRTPGGLLNNNLNNPNTMAAAAAAQAARGRSLTPQPGLRNMGGGPTAFNLSRQASPQPGTAGPYGTSTGTKIPNTLNPPFLPAPPYLETQSIPMRLSTRVASPMPNMGNNMGMNSSNIKQQGPGSSSNYKPSYKTVGQDFNSANNMGNPNPIPNMNQESLNNNFNSGAASQSSKESNSNGPPNGIPLSNNLNPNTSNFQTPQHAGGSLLAPRKASLSGGWSFMGRNRSVGPGAGASGAGGSPLPGQGNPFQGSNHVYQYGGPGNPGPNQTIQSQNVQNNNFQNSTQNQMMGVGPVPMGMQPGQIQQLGPSQQNFQQQNFQQVQQQQNLQYLNQVQQGPGPGMQQNMNNMQSQQQPGNMQPQQQQLIPQQLVTSQNQQSQSINQQVQQQQSQIQNQIPPQQSVVPQLQPQQQTQPQAQQQIPNLPMANTNMQPQQPIQPGPMVGQSTPQPSQFMTINAMDAGAGSSTQISSSSVVQQQSQVQSQPQLQSNTNPTTSSSLDKFSQYKTLILTLEKSSQSQASNSSSSTSEANQDRFGFSSVPYSAFGGLGLEITKVERGGLLAKWNTARRSGGPSQMVGVGDVIITVNGIGPENGDKMRDELSCKSGVIELKVAKMRT